jgi:Rrf2 family iron-sulfur cluster assembly transcriptional regulator
MAKALSPHKKSPCDPGTTIVGSFYPVVYVLMGRSLSRWTFSHAPFLMKVGQRTGQNLAFNRGPFLDTLRRGIIIYQCPIDRGEADIMKLSTRSRYGTRMMLDVAEHGQKGPVQMRDIAKRQGISVKYLEQLIIPLKKANYINSVRGPKGGHRLARPPEQITIGAIVDVLEGGIDLCDCIENAKACESFRRCLARPVWRRATRAMYDQLNAVTLADILAEQKMPGKLSEQSGRASSFPEQEVTATK